MKKRNLVSVIIPVYNREKTIARSINSILKQTYGNLEVIVVDDCSTDSTVEVINKIKDKRLRLIKHKSNMGACAARNTGINHSKGEYIAFNDSDDAWKPQKLELQMNVILQKKADVVFCQVYKHNYDKEEVFPNISEGFVKYNDLVIKSKCSTQTMLVNKEVFKKYLFDEKLPRMQDYDFVVRSAVEFKYFFLKKCLVDVYLQSNSITTSNHYKIYETCKYFYNKYTDLFENNKQFEIYILNNLVYFSVEFNDEQSIHYLKRLFKLKKSMLNLLKIILYKMNILKKVWFHTS